MLQLPPSERFSRFALDRFPPDDGGLARALELAEGAAALSSPNPAVGCVLAHGRSVLGEGAHVYAARDHAEIVALKAAMQAGHTVCGATAYVTLEPCSHHGRTGPCADALVVAGIARCVVATVDPNPLVRGSGLEKLRHAGVEVVLLPPTDSLAQRARRLNDSFAFAVQHGRPFVTLKAAVSRDGMLAPNASLRNAAATPFWLTGEAARKDVQRLRHQSDALLTGIGTVLADNPSLTDRTGQPRGRGLLRVVLDTALRTPPESTLVQSAGPDLLVFYGPKAPQSRVALFAKMGVAAEQIPSGPGGGLDLKAVLASLAERQVRSLLLEGGSTLNAAFLEQQLVDRVVLYQAPVELGAEAVPFALLPPPNASAADGVSGLLGTAFAAGDLIGRLTDRIDAFFSHGKAQDRRISGYLHDPWASVDLPA